MDIVQAEVQQESSSNQVCNLGLFGEGDYGSYEKTRVSGQESLPANKLTERQIEDILYKFTVWKANLAYAQPGSGDEKRNLIIFRGDYQRYVNIIEMVLASLEALEKEFVCNRYFMKVPFKIIADKLSVGERNLYRIRKKVIRQFVIAFGWE